jgi:site-specific DNA-methyltransferase (adenine-specific)
VRSLHEPTFDSIVSTKKPFGFITNYRGKSKSFQGAVKLYGNRRVEYVKKCDITRRSDCVDKHKLIIPKAVGTGDGKTDHIKPLYCEPNSCCTETYLLVGPFSSKSECNNVISYINTKFFHFLVTLQKNTQDCMKKVYSFVPLQDFSHFWTDEKLYKKYCLSKEEIAFIESMVRSMEVSNE